MGRVRFVIGRAGSGKTRHCLTAVQDELRRNPLEGPRLVLLVPEQASLQMERALLAPDDLHAVIRAEVLSFRRLAVRLLREAGPREVTPISEASRVMILRLLMGRSKQQLTYFHRMERLGGLAKSLARAVGDCFLEAVSPEELSAAAADPGLPGFRQARLADLARLYEAYRTYLAEGRMEPQPADAGQAACRTPAGRLLDPGQTWEAARPLLERSAWPIGARIWVDGFAHFSKQELLTLVELARRAERVTIAWLGEPGDRGRELGAEVNRHEKDRREDDAESSWRKGAEGGAHGFGPLDNMRRRIEHALASAGVALERPLFLRDPRRGRFRSAPPLAKLEAAYPWMGLRADPTPERRTHPTGVGDGPRREAVADWSLDDPTASALRHPITLVEAADRRTEVAFAASQIQAWVQAREERKSPEAPMRYRDIAVILRDVETYRDLLIMELNQRGIPFFLDQRRGTAHHPLVEFLRCAAALGKAPFSLAWMRLLLKTGLLPFEASALDALENHLLAWNISGRADWESGKGLMRDRSPANSERSAASSRLVSARAAISALLAPWLELADRRPAPTGAEWAAGLLALMERTAVAETLAVWARAAGQNGQWEEARSHQQVLADVQRFLDDLATTFDHEPVSTAELLDVLESGLAGLTVALPPPMLDEVLIMGIERSRHPEIRAAILLGLNDGVFPLRPRDDGLLHEEDLDCLERHGVHLGRAAREWVEEERLLAYVAVTRPSERLVLCLAREDEAGKPLAPSPLVRAMEAAAPSMARIAVERPVAIGEAWDVASLRELAARAARARHVSRAAGDAGSRPAAFWEEVGRSLAERDGAIDPRVARILSARLDESAKANLKIDPASKPPRETPIGVTALQSFASCPFQHFSRHILDLAPRQTARWRPLDLGRIEHAILEDVIRQIIEKKQDWATIEDGELASLLDAAYRRLPTRLHEIMLRASAREQALLDMARMRLLRVLRGQREASRAGRFRPAFVELSFGREGEAGLPSLRLPSPSGHDLVLKGVLDRVDMELSSMEENRSAVGMEPASREGDRPRRAIVLDYKSSRRKAGLAELYHGLSLQLPIYLLALRNPGESGETWVAAAGFYVTTSEAVVSLKHLEEGSDREQSVPGFSRMRGLVAEAAADLLDPAARGSLSKWYRIRLKKDGEPASPMVSDLLRQADFEALVAHVARLAGTLADRMIEGDVSVLPYRLDQRTPCKTCDYGTVCGFEAGVDASRWLEPLKPAEVLARMAAE